MAESAFTLSFGDLRKEVSEYLYGGTGASAVTHKADVITRMIQSGLRQFYSPPPVGQHLHDWSFLKPTTEKQLNAPYTSTQAVSYTASGNLVSLTAPDAWPERFYNEDNDLSFSTNANNGVFIDLLGISYPVTQFTGARTAALSATDNPGSSNLAAADGLTEVKIHQDDYDLPDDFGRVMGDLTFSEKDKSWHTVKIVGENRIREMRQRDFAVGSTTEPYYAAIKPKAQSATDSIGSRQVIQFWPAITSDATISYRYRVRASHDVTQTNKHPYGASDHSETILSSCLAAAEQRLDGQRGVHYARFMECLVASIELDARSNRAENLGYNSDGSDGASLYEGRLVGSDRVRHKNISGTFID